MKNTLRSIIAAILCASLLCGCSADQKPAEIPADSETAVSSDVSDSGEFTAAPSTVSVESSPAPELSVNSGIAPTEEFSGETSTAEFPVTSDIYSETTPAQSTTGAAPEPVSTAATTVKTTASTVKTSTATKPAELTKFSVDWKLNSTWEEGGNKCGGYEATLTNNSVSDVGSWIVKVTVPSGFKLTASWNGVFSVSGTTLTIKNESYNGSVPSGGNTGFGFNWSCPGDFTPSKATVNGSAASVGTNSGQNGGSVQPATTTPAVTIQTVPPAPEDPDGTTPVAAHGQLSVRGTQLVDKNGKGYQLRGMSTHGITWFPDFVNENAFRTLRDDWNTNVVRMAMYVDEWGNGQCYMQNKEGSTQLLEKGVDICIKLGMYVIIDWHVLNPGDPSQYTDEAIKFFDKMSKKYALCISYVSRLVPDLRVVVHSDDYHLGGESRVSSQRRRNGDSALLVRLGLACSAEQKALQREPYLCRLSPQALPEVDPALLCVYRQTALTYSLGNIEMYSQLLEELRRKVHAPC